jgi:hypothetical protein
MPTAFLPGTRSFCDPIVSPRGRPSGVPQYVLEPRTAGSEAADKLPSYSSSFPEPKGRRTRER